MSKIRLEYIVRERASSPQGIAEASYNLAQMDIERELQGWKQHVFQAHHFGSLSELEYKSMFNLLVVIQNKFKEMRVK